MSISYGAIEQTMSQGSLVAFNQQALQLAAMGTSIVAASGDNGAPGTSPYTGTCDSSSCSADSSSSMGSAIPLGSAYWTGTGYFPTFPCTSPYVTCVGATMGPEIGMPEVAAQSNSYDGPPSSLGGLITTGGKRNIEHRNTGTQMQRHAYRRTSAKKHTHPTHKLTHSLTSITHIIVHTHTLVHTHTRKGASPRSSRSQLGKPLMFQTTLHSFLELHRLLQDTMPKDALCLMSA